MNLETAEIVLGAAAVLAMAVPREEPLLVPEYRDWLGALRRFRPGARRRREEAGGREAEEFVAELRGEVPPMTVRQDELPSVIRSIRAVSLEDAELARAGRPVAPWQPAMFAPRPASGLPAPARRREGPPTIVMEKVRPAIARDLGLYLKSLSGYPDSGTGEPASFS